MQVRRGGPEMTRLASNRNCLGCSSLTWYVAGPVPSDYMSNELHCCAWYTEKGGQKKKTDIPARYCAVYQRALLIRMDLPACRSLEEGKTQRQR